MKRAGFTLIELLVVLAVLSVVSTIGLRMFNVIEDSRRTQTVRLALGEKMDNAIETIRKDFAQVVSARLGGGAISGEHRLEERQREGTVILEDDRITLPVSTPASIDGPAERRTITYHIDRSTGARALVRSTAGISATEVVLPGAMSLRIEYFDGAAWQSAWSAPQHPKAVRVSVVAQDPDRPYEQFARTATFPIRVD